MNIWVNGCFDILHTGHLDLLWHAKLLYTQDLPFNEAMEKNRLYVGIDSDRRVKELKGDNRPINDEYDRYRMLANLKMVDSVVTFHTEEDLKFYIKDFEIDYIVVGDQYKDKVVLGSECSKEGVIFYPVDDRSTTNIIEKIKNL